MLFSKDKNYSESTNHSNPDIIIILKVILWINYCWI